MMMDRVQSHISLNTCLMRWPDQMARPRKPTEEKALRGHFSYRPDQAEKVQKLASQKRLSGVIQAAIDAAELATARPK